MLRIFPIHPSAWNARLPNLGHGTALTGIMPAKATVRGPLVSVEENRAVIRRLFDEVYNGHNLDVLGELVTEDVVNHSATEEHKRGIGDFRHVMEWGAALMPDGRYEVLDTIAEGDMVACRVRVSGTMQGELFGVPATGKGFTAEHVH
jgi:predicted ester cyclase